MKTIIMPFLMLGSLNLSSQIISSEKLLTYPNGNASSKDTSQIYITSGENKNTINVKGADYCSYYLTDSSGTIINSGTLSNDGEIGLDKTNKGRYQLTLVNSKNGHVVIKNIDM